MTVFRAREAIYGRLFVMDLDGSQQKAESTRHEERAKEEIYSGRGAAGASEKGEDRYRDNERAEDVGRRRADRDRTEAASGVR